MKSSQWKEEVERAVAASGLPWRVSFAWIEENAAQCCADVTDRRYENDRTLRLSEKQFVTEAQRRAEIVRQLTNFTTH